MKRVMLVYGTRPEAIKMAPVVRELQRSTRLKPIVVLTGQHASMLEQVNADFGIAADHNLEIMAVGQSLHHITSRALEGVARLIAAERPDVVLVQGDTSSAFSAALAAFYAQVPVAHLEAGLRTDDIYAPFPEEMNRRLTTRLASLHLVPTLSSRENLLRENVAGRTIVVTGNTVIDSLLWTVEQGRPFSDPRLREIERSGVPVLLVTAHRRESWASRCDASHTHWWRSPSGFPSSTSCFRRIAIRSSAMYSCPSSARVATSTSWNHSRIRTSPGSCG